MPFKSSRQKYTPVVHCTSGANGFKATIIPFLETSGKNNGIKLTVKGIKRVVECLDQFLERFSTQNLLYKQGAITMMLVNLFKAQN